MEGGGQLTLGQGKLSGSVNANLVYAGLAKGDFNLGFKDGMPEGGGKVEITQEFLAGVSAGLKIEQGNLTADVTVPAAKIAPPIPGLSVPEGSIQIIMRNGMLSGAITGLRLVYRELGEATLSGQISKDHVEGTGELLINIPAIEPVKGKLGYKSGKLWGEATVSAKQFPASLPVKSGSITAGINEKGDVSFRGEVGVEFASVGRGTLRGAYDKGKLDLGADVTVSVPGLDAVTARIDYKNGELEGEVDVPVASKKLAGITGNLHVAYRNKLWKGETKLGYERDSGKVKGDVTLGLAQTEKGDLAVYGGGAVTARLTDFLAGTLKVDILPEGETKLHGAITVTEPIQLFPEKKADKELFSISRNIPLWAILVAVIRLRAGVRAGIGPGQLRDITVEGEYTVGGEGMPSFQISGELFIPAYAEAYVAFGAGLGLDVVIGSLTGGIEAIGTAGLYGAISVLPVISYRDGNYNINGTATMAAAAKLKLGPAGVGGNRGAVDYRLGEDLAARRMGVGRRPHPCPSGQRELHVRPTGTAQLRIQDLGHRRRAPDPGRHAERRAEGIRGTRGAQEPRRVVGRAQGQGQERRPGAGGGHRQGESTRNPGRSAEAGQEGSAGARRGTAERHGQGGRR